MKKTFRIALVAAATLLVAGAASAQSSPIYASLNVGVSKADIDCSGTSSCSNSSASGRVVVGYSVTPNIALEASYAQLGRNTATVPVTALGPTDVVIRASAFGLGAAFRMPIDAQKQWNANARLGLYALRAEATASFNGGSASTSETSERLYAGLGITYALTPAVDVGVAYDLTSMKLLGATSNINTFTAGVTYKF